MPDYAAPGARLARLWHRLAPLPGGTWLFSRLLGFMVPYTGTIRPHVRELRPGHARVTLRDRRGVRNHLRSVHAVALTNLGEVTSGLAMLLALPPGARSIVTRLSTEYLKKARGPLAAVATVAAPEVTGDLEQEVMAEVTDAAGDVVSRTRVTWRIGPTKRGTGNGERETGRA